MMTLVWANLHILASFTYSALLTQGAAMSKRLSKLCALGMAVVQQLLQSDWLAKPPDLKLSLLQRLLNTINTANEQKAFAKNEPTNNKQQRTAQKQGVYQSMISSMGAAQAAFVSFLLKLVGK